MTPSRFVRLMAASLALGASDAALPQQPFDLDPTFQTGIEYINVNDVWPLPDGSLIVAGQTRVPADPIGFVRLGVKLNPDGSFDPSFATTCISDKIIPWGTGFYAECGTTPRRFLMDGNFDPGFDALWADPLFNPGDGADYHLYPDGSVLLSGSHSLYDTTHGFTGLHSLIWFTNTGRLDTTKIHRKSDDVIFRFTETTDGSFICGGPMSTYEGHPVGHVIRVFPDGELDTTFNCTMNWGWPVLIKPLSDGRVFLFGAFKFVGDPDTLSLVRLLPNGELDPSFNNHLQALYTYDPDPEFAAATSMYPIDPGHYLITGFFTHLEGEDRRSIAVIDTSGQLVSGPIGVGVGCGMYNYMGSNKAVIIGMKPDPWGNLYVFGAYHGYNDGTTNDPGQRMVSRLYGLDVGVGELAVGSWQLAVSPNPASGSVVVRVPNEVRGAQLVLRDALGKERLRQRAVVGENGIGLHTLAPGMYTVVLEQDGQRIASAKLVIEP